MPFITGFLLIGSMALQPTYAYAETIPESLPVVEATSTVASLVEHYSALYGVSGAKMLAILNCESPGLIPDARGDHGLARGLSQIRSDYWPEVSDKQADTPSFAIDFMAKAFSQGHASYWSCYRHLFE